MQVSRDCQVWAEKGSHKWTVRIRFVMDSISFETPWQVQFKQQYCMLTNYQYLNVTECNSGLLFHFKPPKDTVNTWLKYSD